MAGIHFKAITPMITLTASTLETALQIVAATNTRVLLHGLLVSFNGITAADPPIQVDLFIQTTAGTMSSLTLSKNNVLDTETLQTTAQHTATGEPTNTTLKSRFTCISRQISITFRQMDRSRFRVVRNLASC